MNLKNKVADSQTSYKKTAIKTALQCLAVLLIVEIVLTTLNLLFLAFIDQTGVPELIAAVHSFYRIVMIPFFIVVSVFICVYITYRFMLRPLHYLDDVAQAAAILAHPTEVPITLPADLKNIENDLNSVREQTMESRKAAQVSEKRKNDLLVYLAHDLKTPLTSVIGYLKLIEDDTTVSPELISKYAGIAHDKADRLEDLINEFFEITRFSTTKLTLSPESTNLSRMLMQITYEFKPILAEKELEWDLQIPENIEIWCDPDKLERAVDNLIRNAVNYCFEKSAILFSLAKTENGVKICVENKGHTISPEKLALIFEQFYRLDTSRSGDTGGAGLGLAIAKELIELHHGTISASSEDETIRFEILLPVDCHTNLLLK
ncbi:MAG TPA: HAMP domain-containing sensor histidine kinase [Caproicibacter sp.]|nr:HAMP domain-containing sensor histidine kinase [Caproicibacter sp.]